MSNADFQNRLQRITSNAAQQQPIDRTAPHARRSEAQKAGYGPFVLGATVMMLGVQMVKYANENYEAVRDSGAIGTILGLGVGGIVLLLAGCIVSYRAVVKLQAARITKADFQYSDDRAQPARRASTGARVVFSLVGFAFGTVACLYLFMAAGAGFIETEKAQTFSTGGFVIAFFLLLVSLLFGFVGLFLRGRALGRVPVYFLFGAVLTFATFKIANINVLKWQAFVAGLQ